MTMSDIQLSAISQHGHQLERHWHFMWKRLMPTWLPIAQTGCLMLQEQQGDQSLSCAPFPCDLLILYD